jgi:hypothetical protein
MEDKMNQRMLRTILVLVVIGVIAVVGYLALNTPDQRTTGERMGDAVDAISDGVDKAGRQLEDRTAGEKLGDAIKDVGDDIKEKTNP